MAGSGVLTVGRMKLGSQGLEVSRQGLGCMGMSAFYGPPKPEPDMIALIHHAIATGVTFLDTSDIYGPFTNEMLLGKALQGGVREKVELATKFGIVYSEGLRETRGDPAHVRASCEGSLKRLGIDCIDLYYQHRIDIKVPIEVTVDTWEQGDNGYAVSIKFGKQGEGEHVRLGMLSVPRLVSESRLKIRERMLGLGREYQYQDWCQYQG